MYAPTIVYMPECVAKELVKKLNSGVVITDGQVIAAIEASKWVKFDVNDASTWPPPITKQPYASIPVMVYCTDNKETFYSSKFVTNLHRLLPTNKGYAYWIHPFDRDKHINVTH